MPENEVATPTNQTQPKSATNKSVKAPKDNPTEFVNELVFRNNFYRDNFRRVMLFAIILVLVIIAQIGFIFFLHATRTMPSYYATTHDGKQIRLVPLDEPNLTTDALLNWVKSAAVASYSFDFVNWSESLANVKSYYTPDGYQNFMKALQSSGSLEGVRSKKLVVSAVQTGTPVILKEGPINKRYSWQVQLPMLISYQSASEVIKQDINMTMLITRVPTLESEKGIGIAQLTVIEGKGAKK
ncbi:MAG: type IVB secretion system apparatus protein IcmL/DotI [Gammaproteobacteria bacterium]